MLSNESTKSSSLLPSLMMLSVMLTGISTSKGLKKLPSTVLMPSQGEGTTGPEHPADPPGANGGEWVIVQAPRNAKRGRGDPMSGRMQYACEADDAAGAPHK